MKNSTPPFSYIPEVCVCVNPQSPCTIGAPAAPGDVDIFGRFFSSRAMLDVALGVFYPFFR
jgi:hypothetical protein